MALYKGKGAHRDADLADPSGFVLGTYAVPPAAHGRGGVYFCTRIQPAASLMGMGRDIHIWLSVSAICGKVLVAAWGDGVFLSDGAESKEQYCRHCLRVRCCGNPACGDADNLTDYKPSWKDSHPDLYVASIKYSECSTRNEYYD